MQHIYIIVALKLYEAFRALRSGVHLERETWHIYLCAIPFIVEATFTYL